jgi:hypothetical protein
LHYQPSPDAHCERASDATVEIRRVDRVIAMLRMVAVLIDGMRVGGVRNGGTECFKVSAGRHCVAVSLDSIAGEDAIGSETLGIDLAPGMRAVLECDFESGWSNQLHLRCLQEPRIGSVWQVSEEAVDLTLPGTEPSRRSAGVLFGLGLLCLVGNGIALAVAGMVYPWLLALGPILILLGLAGLIDPRIASALSPRAREMPLPLWTRIAAWTLAALGCCTGLLVFFLLRS